MSEHQHAKALMEWVHRSMPLYPELACLYHIPNGGDRNLLVAKKLKAEGTMRGVADYHLPVAKGGFHSLYIELKTPNGKQSQEQKNFQQLVEHYGNKYFVAHGWDKAAECIIDYLNYLPCRLDR